jgi:hypothetical protein
MNFLCRLLIWSFLCCLLAVRGDIILARDRDASLSHQSNHPVT